MRRGEGEATFEAEGRIWRLRVDFNALADFEEASQGRSALVALGKAGAQKGQARDLRLWMWCALREHHPEVDLRAAGRLALPGQVALAEALRSAFPPAEDGAGKA